MNHAVGVSRGRVHASIGRYSRECKVFTPRVRSTVARTNQKSHFTSVTLYPAVLIDEWFPSSPDRPGPSCNRLPYATLASRAGTTDTALTGDPSELTRDWEFGLGIHTPGHFWCGSFHREYVHYKMMWTMTRVKPRETIMAKLALLMLLSWYAFAVRVLPRPDMSLGLIRYAWIGNIQWKRYRTLCHVFLPAAGKGEELIYVVY